MSGLFGHVAPAANALFPTGPLAELVEQRAPRRPGRWLQLVNFAVFQLAWFAAVLGAANHLPAWGTLAVMAAIAWHLSVSARPAAELRLLLSVTAIGMVVECAQVWQGHIVYASGQPVAGLPPYWMIALWSLLAIALNVTMRWLRHRPVVAALLGAVAGPASFASGVRLGAAHFVDPVPALLTMALGWAVLMPLLMWISTRFDGVSVPDTSVPKERHA